MRERLIRERARLIERVYHLDRELERPGFPTLPGQGLRAAVWAAVVARGGRITTRDFATIAGHLGTTSAHVRAAVGALGSHGLLRIVKEGRRGRGAKHGGEWTYELDETTRTEVEVEHG